MHEVFLAHEWKITEFFSENCFYRVFMSDRSTLVKENLFLSKMNTALSLHCFENPFQFLSDTNNKIPSKILKDGPHRDRDFSFFRSW